MKSFNTELYHKTKKDVNRILTKANVVMHMFGALILTFAGWCMIELSGDHFFMSLLSGIASAALVLLTLFVLSSIKEAKKVVESFTEKELKEYYDIYVGELRKAKDIDHEKIDEDEFHNSWLSLVLKIAGKKTGIESDDDI